MNILQKLLSKRAGHKARAKDEIREFLKELWTLKQVGWGVDQLDAAQQKCLLTREELQIVSDWCKKHPHG